MSIEIELVSQSTTNFVNVYFSNKKKKDSGHLVVTFVLQSEIVTSPPWGLVALFF